MAEQNAKLPLDCAISKLTAPVIEGKKIGRKIGFPTANQLFSQDTPIPAHGVYASIAVIDGIRYAAVSNIGTRPTVSGTSVNCESYILDYSDDLYNKDITVYFMRFLRDEERFDSLDTLKRTIEADVSKAQLYLYDYL